jgi:hypothetical protein
MCGVQLYGLIAKILFQYDTLTKGNGLYNSFSSGASPGPSIENVHNVRIEKGSEGFMWREINADGSNRTFIVIQAEIMDT